MISWHYIAIAAVVLFCFLFYKEWKRKNRARLIVRLLASAIAVCSLFFMVYPFAFAEEKNGLNKIIVLTDGFVADSLRQFFKQERRHIAVFSGDRALVHAHPELEIGFVPDLPAFFAKHATDTLHVFGNGFNKEETEKLNDRVVFFHLPDAFAAVQSVSWTKKLTPGQLFSVQGKYSNPGSAKIKISLQAFGETLDSVFIAAKTDTIFSLSGIPKNTGRAAFSMIVSAGDTILQNEPLPMEIKSAPVLKMLMLSAAPDFENTFLKNRLSQNGFSISIQTVIASEKSDRQFLNMPATAAGARLTASYLDQFDLLMADEDALKAISQPELSNIRSNIAGKGTGLVIKLTNEKNAPSFYKSFFQVQQTDSSKKGSFAIYSPAGKGNNYMLEMEAPANIKTQPGTQILLEDLQSNVYAAAALYGEGKIVATTLSNTYSLALAGNNQAYQSLWSLLLQKAARKTLPSINWQTVTPFSFVKEPTRLTMETSEHTVLPATIRDNRIYLEENLLLSYEWQGIYWPEKRGWQWLVQNGQQQYVWWAYQTGDWKKLLDFEKWQAAKNYSMAHPVPSGSGSISMTRWITNLPLYMLLLFLICCGFLWAEQKKL